MYLLIHGAIKVLIVAGLLLNKRWSYPSFTERAHDNDTEAEIRSELEDDPLHLPLRRVIWNLDGRDATRLHDFTQLSKRRRAVVRRPDRRNLSRFFQVLQHRKMISPVHQVMDLVEVYISTKKVQRFSNLIAPFDSGPRHVWDVQIELTGSIIGYSSEVDEVFKSPSHSFC
jgi:hypothetical protein